MSAAQSSTPQSSTPLRNIAIIAHVDHGKTTMVDELLRQSGAVREGAEMDERAMDSNDIERERGITILAKCTSVEWASKTQGDIRINIIDTPGHADFGGEVERILSMVDGVLLLVDAEEGVMPQTKFVLSKALALGLKPVVVLNKVDRPHANPDKVLDEAFDLFVSLDANEDQLDFPVLYASGKEGWADTELEGARKDMSALFETVIAHVAAPEVDGDGNAPFRMLVTTLEADPFLGRILTGRILSGTPQPGLTIKALSADGTTIEQGRISKILAFRGLKRQPIESAEPGDIIAIAGLRKATVANTLCDPELTEPLEARPVDPPTLSVTLAPNDSPLAGREGDKVQSRVIRERLYRQAEGDVAIRISDTPDGDAFEVAGRGELQLGVLIENMRREGFELSVSRPRVLTYKDESGQLLEPMEEIVIDVDEDFSGVVIEKLTIRKCELIEMKPTGGGKTRLVLNGPARALIGYHGEFLTDTRGTGVMNRSYLEHRPHKGAIEGRRNGVLIAMGNGEAVPFALWNLEDRGVLFITPGTKVYQGMIIGENAKNNDLDVNPLKAKQLTNMRASGKDEAVRLTTPRRLSLEQAIAYIDDDELVEVTPQNVRLRKKELEPHMRKKRAKAEMAG